MSAAARLVAIACVTFYLAACDSSPSHYYVFCDGMDANGWQLIDTGYDARGYLVACTYQSLDRQNQYTVRCRANGCD